MLKPQSEERSTITLFSIGQCWDEVGTLTLDRSQVPLTPDKEEKVRQPMFADQFDPSRKYYYSRPLSLSIARSREVVNGPRPHLCDCVRCLRLSKSTPATDDLYARGGSINDRLARVGWGLAFGATRPTTCKLRQRPSAPAPGSGAANSRLPGNGAQGVADLVHGPARGVALGWMAWPD